MAYVPSSISPEDDSQDKKSLQISSATGGATGGNPSAMPAGPTVAPAPSNSSGGFTSVRAFLNSNTAGAQKLGEGVSGLISRETGEARNAIQSGQQTFNQKVAENTVDYNKSDIDETLASSTGTPTSGAQRQLSGTYAGPTTFTDVGARQFIDKEANEAAKTAALAKDQGGRIELLRQYAGRPMTAGVSRLNEAILSGNADARAKVEGAAEDASKLSTEISAAELSAAQAVESAKSKNAETRARALSDINNYLNEQDTNINNTYTQMVNDERARQERAKNYLANLPNYRPDGTVQAGGGSTVSNTPDGRATAQSVSGDRLTNHMVNVTPVVTPIAGFDALGLTPEQSIALQNIIIENRNAGGANVDLSRFYAPADLNTALSKSNTLTPEQASKLNALAGLAGRSGYQSIPKRVGDAFDYSGAITALTNSRDAAKQLAATKAAEEAAKKAAATPPTVINNTTVKKSGGGLIGAVLKPVGKIFGGCVIGGELVNTGMWDMSKYNEIVSWCERTLHGKTLGESLRRGYKFIGCKLAVPGMRKKSLVGKYFKNVFESVSDTASNRDISIFRKGHAYLWLGLCIGIGAFITPEYAKKMVKDLHKDAQ